MLFKNWRSGLGAYSVLSILIVAFCLTQVSCSTSKYNMVNVYLDSTHTIALKEYPFPFKEIRLAPYDVVKVTFAGKDKDVTNELNRYGGADISTTLEASGRGLTSASGLQIDKEGYIQFPLIGKVKAAGLTKYEFQKELFELVKVQLTDPIVNVEITSRGVTFLGEVKNPSSVTFPKEHANLFEMLAQVGFTTEYADLGKVKVYRENTDGSRELGNLNLLDSSFFNSMYFYPQPNDVVYVPASNARVMRNLGQTILPFTGLALGLITLVMSFIR